MKAMLLAAGLGERMLPLTLALPKPVIPVLGVPIAAQILERLARGGVRRAVVNLHHLPDRVRSVLGDGTGLGLDGIHYSHEERILGTSGGIRKAAAELGGEGPFLVHNADFLSDVDLGALASWHARSGFAATLVLAPARRGYTAIEVDDAGRVVSIGGGSGRYLFTGLHILDEDLLSRVPEGPSDIVRDLYLDLVRERKLGGFVHPGFWWEFGSPRSYLEGSLALLALVPERLDGIARTDAVRHFGEATVAVGLGADFHGGVALDGRVALGMACLVGEGSVLEDTVVMPEAWVGPGSRLRRVVVGPGVELPAGFELEDALVCSGGDADLEPPPGTVRQGALFVKPLAPGR